MRLSLSTTAASFTVTAWAWVLKIAAALNREGITSPRVYWSQINGKDGCKAAQLWTYATVKTILHNEVYKGTLVMNHTGTRSYNSTDLILLLRSRKW